MHNRDFIDNIMPSAAPTEDEIRRWQALPRDEQIRRLAMAISDGFNSGSTEHSIEQIISRARHRAGLANRTSS